MFVTYKGVVNSINLSTNENVIILNMALIYFYKILRFSTSIYYSIILVGK